MSKVGEGSYNWFFVDWKTFCLFFCDVSGLNRKCFEFVLNLKKTRTIISKLFIPSHQKLFIQIKKSFLFKCVLLSCEALQKSSEACFALELVRFRPKRFCLIVKISESEPNIKSVICLRSWFAPLLFSI